MLLKLGGGGGGALGRNIYRNVCNLMYLTIHCCLPGLYDASDIIHLFHRTVH